MKFKFELELEWELLVKVLLVGLGVSISTDVALATLGLGRADWPSLRLDCCHVILVRRGRGGKGRQTRVIGAAAGMKPAPNLNGMKVR